MLKFESCEPETSLVGCFLLTIIVTKSLVYLSQLYRYKI